MHDGVIWLEVKFVKRQEGPEKALKVSKRGDDLNIWRFCGLALARALARVNNKGVEIVPHDHEKGCNHPVTGNATRAPLCKSCPSPTKSG